MAPSPEPHKSVCDTLSPPRPVHQGPRQLPPPQGMSSARQGKATGNWESRAIEFIQDAAVWQGVFDRRKMPSVVHVGERLSIKTLQLSLQFSPQSHTTQSLLI